MKDFKILRDRIFNKLPLDKQDLAKYIRLQWEHEQRERKRKEQEEFNKLKNALKQALKEIKEEERNTI